jgi:hypothetical protein
MTIHIVALAHECFVTGGGASGGAGFSSELAVIALSSSNPDSLETPCENQSGNGGIIRIALHAAGRRMENLVPASGWLSTSIVPACASTIALLIDRPRPAPPVPLARDLSAR